MHGHSNVESRKHVRTIASQPARIDLGDGVFVRDCILSDISPTGARITVSPVDDVPD
jgi:hypothetical protein